ncbi:tight adherence protein B [Microbacterium ginsengiterrae]|uniref:Tight adherence protein B n=1 Tax=Microbacterium ginsengiterrae TaxID=546115 RepID=A0A7W9CBA6_9MICO|nr:tight adherence protein B [Microbacterium ginsengiterrae]
MVSLLRRSHDSPGAASAAASVRTLAVLLQAGAAPLRAWRHLADSGDLIAQSVVARCDGGLPLTEAIEAEGGAWGDVAAAWDVASTVGAPLAEMLRSLAETMQDAASAADDVRIALAEPAGTARLLLWMPLAGLLLGFALGFDTVGVLLGNPIGIGCLIAGLLLVLGARVWTRRLLRRAQPDPGSPGMHADLMAVALSGGASISRSLRIVEDASSHDRLHSGRTAQVLELSRAAGVPAGELLRAAAAQERHDARVTGRMRAAKLSSQLLVPLGVCTLPAFLLLGVAPLILSVLTSTPLPI